MPRKARLSPAASFFHVMARGIEGRDIFATDEDRERFLGLLSTGLARTGYACYAWALMRNHYHLVLRSSDVHLSALMRPLNAAYAQGFSKAHSRTGYLFQGRYKSVVTQDQGYVEQLVRYVHANPLRVGVCKTLTDLANYRWTGHAVLMGTREAAFQDTWPVLRRFGRTVADGRKGYAEFIAEAVNQSSESLSVLRKGNTDRDGRTPGSYVIGDPEFVRSVIAKERENRLRIARHQLERLSIEDLAAKFAAAAGITPEDLLRRARGNYRAAARKVFAYVCCREYGFTIVDVARYLGHTHSPMSLAVRQGGQLWASPDFAEVQMALRP